MPNVYLIGGCNGAGKTTIALTMLPRYLDCHEFVNADLIAAGLSPFQVESVALQAGRLMLERMNKLRDAGVDFGFESTLASRSFVPFLKSCQFHGYKVHLLYVRLNNVELAIERVANRVLEGGHNIPEDTIRRRYEAGRRNFTGLYLPLADECRVFDNTTHLQLVDASVQNETTRKMLEGARVAVTNALKKRQ
ncbi:MAG TPA: zeta toxin family protein, partial [Abditibacteriaceae bacterium]|nr:zeta toxin family protein [Abditibacteriaceae bacterium]